MSQQSFVEYYENFLAQPSNAQMREALDATEAADFARIAVEQGQSNGFDFNADDVKAVMVSAERRVLGLPTSSPSVNIRSISSVNGIKARPANRELSEEELESVAGGLASSGVEALLCVAGSLSGLPHFIINFEMQCLIEKQSLKALPRNN